MFDRLVNSSSQLSLLRITLFTAFSLQLLERLPNPLDPTLFYLLEVALTFRSMYDWLVYSCSQSSLFRIAPFAVFLSQLLERLSNPLDPTLSS